MVTNPSQGGDHDERPRGAAGLMMRFRQRARDLGPARTVRLGAVGLAALAVLSSASLATPSQIAVPAEGAEMTVTPSSAPTTTSDLRSERADRTDRSTSRPSAPTSSTPSASEKSSASEKKQAATSQMTAVAPEKSTSTAKTTAKTTAKATAEPAAKATVPAAAGTRYTRVDLNVRTQPSDSAALADVIDSGSKITIAAKTSGSWQSVVHDGALGWVMAQYLVINKPSSSNPSSAASSSSGSSSSGSSSAGSSSAGSSSAGSGSSTGSTSSGGVSSAACASGSSVETGGLMRDAVAVHRAVCAQFPQITSYGGVRADSLPEHPSGRAIDCMLPNYSSASGNALGWRVANWLKANAGRLGISQILFDQRIWTVQRGSEGWRSMSNRGGATANHRDHVHVTVYGNAS